MRNRYFILLLGFFVLFIFSCNSEEESGLLDTINKNPKDSVSESPLDNESDETGEETADTESDTALSEDRAFSDLHVLDDIHNINCGNGIKETGEICDKDTRDCRELDSRFISGLAECKKDCSGYDTSLCKTNIINDGGTDIYQDSFTDYGTDTEETSNDTGTDTANISDIYSDISDVSFDTGYDAGQVIYPECSKDEDCKDINRGCFNGICRDKCIPYVKPCDWKPSGNICTLKGYCVECQKDSDCPGTRYKCDTSKFLCVDKPFNPNNTVIGVFYHTWHCPSAEDVHDLSKILAGQEQWPPWPQNPFPPTSFWWGEPEAGYYCLTNNNALLKKHAETLRDIGAQFVFVDVTNHPYNTGTLCDRPEKMIIEPFTTMVAVWSQVPNAPRIVPWVPVTSITTSDTSKYMVFTLLNLLNKYPGLQFVYKGKPLILVTVNDQWPADDKTISTLANNYTIRKMWAIEPEGTEKWSYLERCKASPLEGQPCFQRISKLNGLPEQFPIALAYGADYMSHTDTATPKYHGKTFRKQFETLFNNPEIPVATIAGWNEWVVGRQPCDLVPLCPCSDPRNKNGCFLDQYDKEYNRDIEPAKNEMGDYYVRLVKACITLFRSGGRCDAAHKDDLCCKDWQP